MSVDVKQLKQILAAKAAIAQKTAYSINQIRLYKTKYINLKYH